MKFLIQRVNHASVKVDGEIIGKIGHGFLVFVGVGHGDDTTVADKYLQKMLKLRIFEDENGKTNRSLADVGGELLLVSQFTLYADCVHGNRPSFTDAGAPGPASELFDYIVGKCRECVPVVQTGKFGADMKVELENDGPFTIMLENL